MLIDDQWKVKIADFGLSKVCRLLSRGTLDLTDVLSIDHTIICHPSLQVRQGSYVSSGNAGGTPEWMAPEVLRCERFDERADVYRWVIHGGKFGGFSKLGGVVGGRGSRSAGKKCSG